MRNARAILITVAFILSTRRAGSTWLNAVLGSHAGTAGLGEYFRPFEIPGHTACRLCEADGLAACRVLHGIEHVPIDEAYAFAAERTGKNILIECSKNLHWPRPFLAQEDLDCRFIHLVRHPAGYLESELRRRPDESIEVIAREWNDQNRNIEIFLRGANRPSYLASYELLADFPEIYFPSLCRSLGFEYDERSLQYWEFEHHGLGGNGANSAYLRDRKVKEFITGDDAYYETIRERKSADSRWKERLTTERIATATSGSYAEEMAKRLAIRW